MSKKVKTLIILLICIIVILLITDGIIIAKKANVVETKEIKETKVEKTKDITVVPTMSDKITADSSWCGTFQLVWNDVKNELVKGDVIFSPQLEIVKNLNKEDFNESMLSEDYYFKAYGLKTLELKEKIENGVKEKFNQTSDIISNLDWSDNNGYVFYSMLYRKFEYLNAFDNLENGKFGNKYNDVEYFGIDNNTEDYIGNQIKVLYYNSKDDFAILINTKTGDEVIFCKNPTGNNFNDIYINMNNKSSKYTGNKQFEDIDEFKAPKLTINETREYTELKGKKFEAADNSIVEIKEAMQTIQFSLDENGGEIKSEFNLWATSSDTAMEKPRYFYVDDTFAIFLREKGKEKPYFAGRVDNITKFQ